MFLFYLYLYSFRSINTIRLKGGIKLAVFPVRSRTILRKIKCFDLREWAKRDSRRRTEDGTILTDFFRPSPGSCFRAHALLAVAPFPSSSTFPASLFSYPVRTISNLTVEERRLRRIALRMTQEADVAQNRRRDVQLRNGNLKNRATSVIGNEIRGNLCGFNIKFIWMFGVEIAFNFFFFFLEAAVCSVPQNSWKIEEGGMMFIEKQQKGKYLVAPEFQKNRWLD